MLNLSITDYVYNELFRKGEDETARFFTESDEGCCVKSVGLREGSEDLRITYISGIRKTREKTTAMAMRISMRHQNNIVHSFCDPTNGIVHDLFDSFRLLCFGSQLDSVEKLTLLWRGLLAEMGEGKIIHYAHSRGGLVTKVALSNLTPEEKSRIEVVLFGSPAVIGDDECSHVVDVINCYDPIPYSNPRKWINIMSCFGSNQLRIFGEIFGHSLNGHYLSTLGEIGDQMAERFFHRAGPSLENNVV